MTLFWKMLFQPEQARIEGNEKLQEICLRIGEQQQAIEDLDAATKKFKKYMEELNFNIKDCGTKGLDPSELVLKRKKYTSEMERIKPDQQIAKMQKTLLTMQNAKKDLEQKLQELKLKH